MSTEWNNNTGETGVLRFYISSTDKFKHTPLYEVIVFSAKRYDLSGATVLRGVMGYGGSSIVGSGRLWEVSEKLPMIVEIIDEQEKLRYFLEMVRPYFAKIRNGCVVTLDKTTVVLSRTGCSAK